MNEKIFVNIFSRNCEFVQNFHEIRSKFSRNLRNSFEIVQSFCEIRSKFSIPIVLNSYFFFSQKYNLLDAKWKIFDFYRTKVLRKLKSFPKMWLKISSNFVRSFSRISFNENFDMLSISEILIF